ncbi:hypothetical protein AERO8C_150134 [Aeromonas veronii]|uniref:Uncharacterized protein n=1 Tax=Aeromonas veronii TaxID=654 RepID=A0A653KXQ9_AERVE|nr:hypothetical protein AERO8C_150134 [Aeromonas veronii]
MTRQGSPRDRATASPISPATVSSSNGTLSSHSGNKACRARSCALGTAPRASASATTPSLPLSPTAPPIPATGLMMNPNRNMPASLAMATIFIFSPLWDKQWRPC